MARAAWLVIALLLIPASLAPAPIAQAPASDRLQLGPVELTLGMPKKATIDALKRHYHVERARSAGDDWAVSEKELTVGIVSFSSDKLSRASKTWISTQGRGAAALATQLFLLARQFGNEGRTQCTLSAKPYRITGAEGRVVTLVCGAKSVQLFQSTVAGGGSAISLQEVLQ